jgi:hypothetical protein
MVINRDREILYAYRLGWSNRDMKTPNLCHLYGIAILKKAYNLGWDHYKIGQEKPIIDTLTNKEIIELCKMELYGLVG